MILKFVNLGKQEVGIWWVQKCFPRYGVPIWSLWPNIRSLPSIVAEKNVTKNVHICSMCIKNQLSRQTGSRNLTGPKTLPTFILLYIVFFIHIEHTFCICPFLVPFFSTIIDGRNLILGHKLHIGTPYRGTPALRQTGSRNPTGQKTLPTIWGTYMKLVTKYQIFAINSCWEKCDEQDEHIGIPYCG
jgi:hypothetical protein